MNWLGYMIQKYVNKNDIVLDLGCGIMQATTGIYDGYKDKEFLKCKTILGVDLVFKYLKKVSPYYPTIRMNIMDSWKFGINSFDVVICTDVIEHLEINDAIQLLKNMKLIARKYVVIYTPLNFDPNGDNVEDSWGMGKNLLQKHHCLITQSQLADLGFKTKIEDKAHNIFGVWKNESL